MIIQLLSFQTRATCCKFFIFFLSLSTYFGSFDEQTDTDRGVLGQKFSPGIFCPDQPTTLSADTT